MPRYKLRVPEAGTMLYGDGYSDRAMVADTLSEARDLWEDYEGERPIYLHSLIGVCGVVYKRDIDNGDAHEDAEPGDTTVWYADDDGRDLRAHECRVWMLGAPSPHWEMKPMEPLPIPWREIPVGMGVRHLVWGWGEVCGPLRPWRASRFPIVPVRFDDGRRADLFLGQITLYYSAVYGKGPKPPPTRYRLTVAGELVAEGVTERTAQDLLALRRARLRAEWEAEQFAACEVAEAVAA